MTIGVVFGTLIGYALLHLRSQNQEKTGHLESDKALQELKTKCELVAQDITREKEGRAKDDVSAQSERRRLEDQLNESQSKIQQQSASTAHAEAMSLSAAEQVKSLLTRQATDTEEIARFRESVQTLEKSDSSSTARADEAERGKTESISNLTNSHTRELQSIKIAHDESCDSLRMQARNRQTENENEVIALKAAQVKTETVLREAHEKELAVQRLMIDDLKSYIDKADETLKVSFGDASTKALQDATKKFFELAQSRFKEDQDQAAKRAETEKKEIEHLLEPVQKELGELEKLTHEMNKERAESFGVLKNTIENLSKTSDSLVNALKKPSVRGSWGEGQLISILESSGWEQGKNFDVQDSTDDDGKTLRTDVVIHLPRGRKIIIDSKAPLDSYMRAMETNEEAEKTRCCQEHAKAVRGHVKALEKKEYWSRYAEAPHYTILFLPYESAYQIAFENDRSLMDDAHRAKIIIANPMTLMNLIHLATYVLNEERMQQNTEEVRNHGRQLCERLGIVLNKMNAHGKHLRSAADSYNEMVGSTRSRLLPSANRMKELGVGTPEPMVIPELVDTAITYLSLPDAPRSIELDPNVHNFAAKATQAT